MVLAAGMGRRFGGEPHKCLTPLRFGEGTLQRLLRQLAAGETGWPVCVVTGHRAPSVTAATRSLLPDAAVVFNPSFADGSLVVSLAAGLSAFRSQSGIEGAWVLFGDAIYQPEALRRILSAEPTSLVIASQPPAARSDHPIGLRFRSPDGRLLGIGPDVPLPDGVMAPAVYWPRRHWPAVVAAAAQGRTFQWQVLAEQAVGSPAVVLPLPAAQAWDIDTPNDLATSRQALLSPSLRTYFRINISKEERNLDRGADHLLNGRFHKIAPSAAHAERERSALRWLQTRQVPPMTPGLRGLQGRELHMEYVEGVRLYDLLRLLRGIAGEGGKQGAAARAAGLKLLHRCLERLLRLQSDLFAWPRAAAFPPYPLDSHTTELVAALAEVLGLPPLAVAERHELTALQRLWEERDACLPFRDATPKNILVAIPSLAPHVGRDPQDRLQALRSWLARGEADTVRIVDVDFTSVGHRTAPEDDLYSLLAHAGSLPWGKQVLAELIPAEPFWPRAIAQLVPRIHPNFAPDPERAARALLVRYLRFGGRKLLYRAVNPAAYAVRFRYDDPTVYFATLCRELRCLDPGFGRSFPFLSDRLHQLHRAIVLLPPWHGLEAKHDFYRENGAPSVAYWQESPLENRATLSRRGPAE